MIKKHSNNDGLNGVMSPARGKHSHRLPPYSRPSSESKSKPRNKSSPKSVSTPNLETHQQVPPTPTTSPRPFTLACPFYKLNPAAYQSCARLKLSKISYVKQHLVRHHMVPTHCPRCLEVFSTFKDFEAHLRRKERCEERSGKIEGITEAVKEKLSRRSDHSVDEAEQWRDIWKIVFEREPPASPYIDLDLPEEINWYNDYLFSQVPDRLSGKDVPQSLAERRELVLGTVEEIARDWKSLWQQGRVTAI
ncbi:hypothetical protein F4680DRAFT_439460 [Xylaria scruposa]|nr:hypothetical protein F4680DRAFT_439460 [Xylaria scruposa]